MIKVEKDKEKEKKKPRGLKRNEACRSVSRDMGSMGRRRREDGGEGESSTFCSSFPLVRGRGQPIYLTHGS